MKYIRSIPISKPARVLFEVGFTTGKGSGLGLALIKRARRPLKSE